jgi:hypothetical protein
MTIAVNYVDNLVLSPEHMLGSYGNCQLPICMNRHNIRRYLLRILVKSFYKPEERGMDIKSMNLFIGYPVIIQPPKEARKLLSFSGQKKELILIDPAERKRLFGQLAGQPDFIGRGKEDDLFHVTFYPHRRGASPFLQHEKKMDAIKNRPDFSDNPKSALQELSEAFSRIPLPSHLPIVLPVKPDSPKKIWQP